MLESPSSFPPTETKSDALLVPGIDSESLFETELDLAQVVVDATIESLADIREPLSESERALVYERCSDFLSKLNGLDAEVIEEHFHVLIGELLSELQSKVDHQEVNIQNRIDAAEFFPFLEDELAEHEALLETSKADLEKLEQVQSSSIISRVASTITSELREKWILGMPMAAPVVAAATGGDVGKTLIGASILTAGLWVMDKTLDGLMDTLGDVLPAWAFTLAIAASTNMAELGTTAVAGAAGDPLLQVPNTPLGSNPWNVGLAVLALGLAVGAGRFKEEGIVEGLKKVDWAAAGKQAGLATVLASSAMSFKLFVHDVGPELFTWAAANSALVGLYLWKNNFSPRTRLNNSISEKSVEELKSVAESIQALPDSVSKPLDQILERMLALKNTEESGGKKPQEHELLAALKDFREGIGKEKLDDLGKYLEENPERQELVRSFLKDFGLNLEDKPVDWKAWGKIGLCCGVLLACSIALDHGVSELGSGLQLGKGTASLILMSLFSSAPEALTSMKMFMMHRDKDAWKNMADSNAVNVILANFGLSLRAARGALLG